jgi:hypothetical protein
MVAGQIGPKPNRLQVKSAPDQIIVLLCFFYFDNIDDRIDLCDLVLNFVILNNLNNNRLSSIQ